MTDTQNTFSVKLYISQQDVRRFIFSGSSFQALKEKILTITNLQDNRNIHVQLKYLDNEGDQVLLSSDSDLSYALTISDKLLKIYLYTQTLISVPPWRQHDNYCPLQNINYEPRKRVKEIDARFIRHETYQDNSEIAVHTNFQKSWVIRNIGTLRWPEGCYFLQIDRANDLNAPLRTPVDSINPNEELTVTVPLKTPNLPGLYQTYFKLCTPQGKKFGQRMRCQILTISDSIICPDRIDKVWEQLEAMGFISKGERSNEISTLILKENCDIPRIVRSLVKQQ